VVIDLSSGWCVFTNCICEPHTIKVTKITYGRVLSVLRNVRICTVLTVSIVLLVS